MSLLSQIATTSSQLSSTLLSEVGSNLLSLQNYGGVEPLLATGSYGWTDLDIADDNSNLPRLTNDECAGFMGFEASASTLKTTLATELAKTLCVPSTAVQFSSSAITCAAQYPFQTGGDQHATFTVHLQIKSLFAFFASGASYVMYANASAVNVGMQSPETTAPLNQQNVRSALQTSLRRLFLEANTANDGLWAL